MQPQRQVLQELLPLPPVDDPPALCRLQHVLDQRRGAPPRLLRGALKHEGLAVVRHVDAGGAGLQPRLPVHLDGHRRTCTQPHTPRLAQPQSAAQADLQAKQMEPG
jgi:hypothetical protein